MQIFADHRIKLLEKEAEKRESVLRTDPTDEDKYEELYNIIRDTHKFVDDKKEDLARVGEIMKIVENNFFKPDVIFNQLTKNWKIPSQILVSYNIGKDYLDDKKIIFENELEKRKKDLYNDVRRLDDKFEEIKKINTFITDKTDSGNSNKNYDIIMDYGRELKQCKEEKDFILRTMKILYPENKQEIERGEIEVAGAERIEAIHKDFQLYQLLWSEANDIMQIYDSEIDKELKVIPRSVQGNLETFEFITRLDKAYQNNENVAKLGIMDMTLIKLTNEFRDTIKQYQSYNWIVSNLNSMYLKDDDWKELRTIMENNDISSSVTLRKMKKEFNIDEYKANIELIKSKATRRAAFFNEYKIIHKEFTEIKFKIVYKENKCYIKEIEDIQLKLDEHNNKLVNIYSNPVTQTDLTLKGLSKSHIERIKIVQDILEQMVKFQASYLYLEPIFSASDSKVLSDNITEFKKVNSFWKSTIDNLENMCSQNLAEYIEKENPNNILKNFTDNCASLDKITKSLNDYLNTKRKAFPRFYFVSDEDLMRILAQTKDPTLIQPHIQMCFEGINRLVFDKTDSIIEGMISPGGEQVNLIKSINVNDDSCKGNIERWLTILEKSMRETMMNITENCLKDFINKPKRIDWIQSGWPGQIVQVVDHVIWTRETENALTAQEGDALAEYIQRVDNDLNDIVKLVRTNISKALSITISGLIIISVHNRDILVDELQAKGISSLEEFEWIAQMRYYYEDITNKKAKRGEILSPLVVKMINASINYGFEYLGNITRLVITQLTDRCFRTLFGAFQVNFGGAPEGPAGTGKTESVKDLSKCCGVMCNVNNCTEGLTIDGMSKFFKGLCSSGLWCCFDEFNRIDTEVLSVIAQQITSIQFALKDKKTLFIFEEEEIELRNTCAINITMNPSYSGRNDLPDNLKILFRPCAMMVANYFLIAQIKLFSFGFYSAKNLANKVVSSLKLSSEQLSTQSHYDFGMRALNAILTAAGVLKKKFPDMDEDRIVLRALLDVNLPKFTTNDIPLFKGIVGDLFPTSQALEMDLNLLENALVDTCERKNLQANRNFIKKCMQLYQTMNVRHALMIVGKAGNAKSMVIKALKSSINKLKDEPGFNVCKKLTLNPKSILQKQLYGYIDFSTKEWKKGLIQIKMTELVEMDKKVFKWLLFDGPVDTLWIENMNSLLDDNKKLCLEDSSSIYLAENMNILFEVDDLKEASPATVSRNGMVLCENDTIDFKDIILSYHNKLPTIFEGKLGDHFKDVGVWLIENLLEFVFNKCTLEIPTDRLHLTRSFLNVFECHLHEYRLKDAGLETISVKSTEFTIEKLENVLIFSAIIGLCGSLNNTANLKEYLFDLIIGRDVNNDYKLDIKSFVPRKLSTKLHDLGNIFDYVYMFSTGKWMKWIEIKEQLNIVETMKFNDIIIPTPTTIKIDYLINQVIPSKKHLLLTGSTGTGKTLTVVNTLAKSFENEIYTFMKICLTAQTSANQIQAIIESKLQKGYRKFTPTNSRKGVIFIDDLNMPQKEKFGAQPPIELLRQWMDYKGWYELFSETKDFYNINEVSFITSMGSISSGRTITNRYLRHFIVMYMENYSQQVMENIYSSVMQWYILKNKQPSISDKIIGIKDTIIKSTIQLFTSVNSTFKATPAKSHYSFNLRDITKIFQGITRTNGWGIRDDNEMIKLWIHECERVFKDRLTNEYDRSTYDGLISTVMKNTIKRSYETYTRNNIILFGNFVDMIYRDNDKSLPPIRKVYCELNDENKLKETLIGKLEKYNSENSGSGGGLNLVLFPYAIEHIVRISRIISMDSGNANALLVGVGGSGRKSLTILSAFINEFKVQLNENVNEMDFGAWRDHLRTNVIDIVVSGNELVFILSDTQITNEAFLEDINNMLNTGEIPNLVESQQLQNYKDNIHPDYCGGKKLVTDSEILAALIELCKAKIHIVLCMSPIGEAFRRRVLNLPSLVNCNTIDWFLPWPEQALSAVAMHYLNDIEVEEQHLNSIINICVDMQSRVSHYSELYYQQLRRYYYVTPMSFIELLNLFKNLLKKRSEEIKKEIYRYENGLSTLEMSEQLVMTMKEQIDKKLQPQLTESKKQCTEKAAELEILTKSLTIQEEETSKKEQISAEIEKESKEISEVSNVKLLEITSKKERANQLAAEIKDKDIAVIKSLKKPTPSLEKFTTCLCLLMLKDCHPKVKGKETPSYFLHAVNNLLSKSEFLKNFKTFKDGKLYTMPKDNIDHLRDIIETLNVEKAEFEASKGDVAFFACREANALYEIINLYKDLYYINIEYIPTKMKADEATAKYKEAQEILNKIREELAETRKVKQQKEDERIALETKKEELTKMLEKCKKRLEAGTELVSSLASEKSDWKIRKDELKKFSANILGDILISSGIIAYLGAFTKSYRTEIVNAWCKLINEKNIPISKSEPLMIMQNILGDSMEIENWKQKKLPNDTFSVDNALIMGNSSRWPLLIDPQSQAVDFIIEYYNPKTEEITSMKNKKTQVIAPFHVIRPTFTQREIIQKVELCAKNGLTLLFENVDENLMNLLTPLYKKDYVREGGIAYLCLNKNSKVEVAENSFKFFIATKLPKPHYLPEICVALTIVNFTVTEDGMEDQMLNFVFEKEEPRTEEMRKKFVEKVNTFNKNKKKQEILILNLLSQNENSPDSDNTILDNHSLIETLRSSKEKNQEFALELKKNESTQEEIRTKQSLYRPVAHHVAQLFFTVQDLSNIEPVYQYSLNSYKNIFSIAIADTNESGIKDKKLEALKNNFTTLLFTKICMSLFEKDKLVFSFLLFAKLNMIGMTPEEYALYIIETRLIVTGGSGKETTIPNPATQAEKTQTWLSDNGWNAICEIAGLSINFKDLEKSFISNLTDWKKVITANNPMDEDFPSPFNHLDFFHKLIIVRILRPEKTIPNLKKLIASKMGNYFITSHDIDIFKEYKDSKNTTPLFFILSPGADPNAKIKLLASKAGKDYYNDVKSLSLGQGQEANARNKIELAKSEQKWIILQNCHLAKKFMIELEKIIDNIKEDPNSSFRLFITALPSKTIPLSIIQNSIKLTNEPPRGLKTSLASAYSSIESTIFDGCAKPTLYKRFFYSLCFFHALILERRKYGPLGWNIPYEFSISDLNISLQQLHEFVGKYNQIQWQAINYVIAEANYGGRVTDPADRKLINYILKDILNEDMLKTTFKFSGMKEFTIPGEGTIADHIKFIGELSDIETPAIFGLHDNADISCAINETNSVFGNTLLTLPKTVSAKAGLSMEDEVKAKAQDVLNKLPDFFDIEKVRTKHKVIHEESLNSLLHQELMRYNNLLSIIKITMNKIIKAIVGEAPMTPDLDLILSNLYDNKTPQIIEKVSYPSLKPFASWVNDLNAKLHFMQSWIDNGIPTTFWISGFYFTQSFLTGVLQNYARKVNIY